MLSLHERCINGWRTMPRRLPVIVAWWDLLRTGMGRPQNWQRLLNRAASAESCVTPPARPQNMGLVCCASNAFSAAIDEVKTHPFHAG